LFLFALQFFKRLIAELFPSADVERFINERLQVGNLPMLSRYDMREKFFRPLEALLAEPGRQGDAFDLHCDRSRFRSSGRLFHHEEVCLAVRMLGLRPAISLSVLFLRKFLVEFGLLLQRVSQNNAPGAWQDSLQFFVNSWNQNTFVRVLYPALCLHLREHLDLSMASVDEPQFSQPRIRAALLWMVTQGAFQGRADPALHGHASKMHCAATGFLVDGIAKRGWLKAIFDEVVGQQDDPLTQFDLKRINHHAELLARRIS
jgi:hypothetical protein